MKKILKIITIALLSLACLVTAVACSSNDDDASEKGLLCKEIGGVYTIYDYVDEDQPKTVLDLGEELGDQVSDVRIKKDAFYGNATIKKIIVPASVTTIDECAFAGMKALEEITLPFVGATVDAVENARTFGYLFGTSEYDGGSLVNTTYSASGTEARYMPSTLRTVVINAGADYKVPMYAFSGCVNLTTVTLAGEIAEIGEYAFSNCKNLSSTNVPATVVKINKGAYSGCTALNTTFANGLSTVAEIGESAFEGAKLNDVVLASGVKIGNKAFYNSTVKQITLKGEVEIGASAFANCVKLTTVNLDGVSNGIIRQFAFQGAVKLNQVGNLEGVINLANFTVENLAFADIFEDSSKIIYHTTQNADVIFGWN